MAQNSLGFTLSYENVGGGTPAELCVVDFNLPTVKLAKPKIRTTDHCTTGTHTYIQGVLKDVDDYTVKLNWSKTIHTSLYALIGTEKLWTIGFPDGSTYEHNGAITSIGVSGTSIDEDVVTLDLTISVNGDVTFTAAV